MASKIKGGSFTFAQEVESSNASFDKYFAWLTKKNDTGLLWPYHIEFNDIPSVTKKLYIFSKKKYYYGVILSGKTRLFQHVLSRENGKVTIKAIRIKGEPPVELNFFCIRKDSGKGIYSHYVGSYPFHIFIKDLWGTYRFFVNLMKKKAEVKNKLSTDKINSLYSLQGKCQYGPLFSPEEFKKLIEKLRYIDEVRLTTYEIDSEEDEPVLNIFNSKREVYSLNNEKVIGKKIREWIYGLRDKAVKPLKNNKIKHTGAISGYDDQKNPVTIDFDKTMQNFINYDYDDLGSIEIDQLFQHDIISLMISRLKNEKLFEPTK